MKEPRVLIAGVGNVFLGDDGFGVEVARRLLERSWPAGVRVEDFGIRGIDFAYTLLDGWDAAILVDALRRGRSPGTLYVVEPDVIAPDGHDPANLRLDTHGMDPARVLAFVRAMGGRADRLRVVGCEPRTFGDGDEPAVGLSREVMAAVPAAVTIIESLVGELFGSLPERHHA
jgi:hydrogenase maturation protease